MRENNIVICFTILGNLVSGILMTAHYMSEYNQDRFVLDIIAQETAPPHRQAKAQVYVSTRKD